MMKPLAMALFVVFSATTILYAQTDVNSLVQKVRARIEQVNDYQATGRMKTNVTFLKVPEANVNIYFKKPDKIRIKNEKGVSFIPRGAMSISLNNIVSGNRFTAIDAGTDRIKGKTVRVIRLLPDDDNAEVVLSTIYVDESNLVIVKAKTTTRENGTYELEMDYGKYTSWGLPDKLLFTFNTKEYKLPKGVTFDFDDGTQSNKPAKAVTNGNEKGRAEITFNQYTINKGVSDEMFAKPVKGN